MKFTRKQKAEFGERVTKGLVERICIVCDKDVEVSEPILIPEHIREVPVSEKCQVIEKDGRKYIRRHSDICREHQIEWVKELANPDGKSLMGIYFEYKGKGGDEHG